MDPGHMEASLLPTHPVKMQVIEDVMNTYALQMSPQLLPPTAEPSVFTLVFKGTPRIFCIKQTYVTRQKTHDG